MFVVSPLERQRDREAVPRLGPSRRPRPAVIATPRRDMPPMPVPGSCSTAVLGPSTVRCVTDHIAALKALRDAITERDAYETQFLATTPLPPYGPAPERAMPDPAEMDRLDTLVHVRGVAYDRAWNEAGRPEPHYPWRTPTVAGDTEPPALIG
jgi:hypothetical protein